RQPCWRQRIRRRRIRSISKILGGAMAMMHMDNRVVWLILGITVVLVAGCGSQGEAAKQSAPAPAASSTSSAASPITAFDGAATVRMSQVTTPPASWDPIQVRNPADASYETLVYDRLVTLKPDLTVGPQLVTSWKFSNDAKNLEMQLRKDVKFQDGTPFNA